ncbi:hypothetical protein BDU57DRAFT_427350, partial [Ampelomyces quisqualis]
MPGLASKPPHLAIPHESTLSVRLQHRDSRLVNYRFAIEEEDESTGTASEPAEPLTPTSHTSESMPFSHPFRNDEHADDVFETPKPTATD